MLNYNNRIVAVVLTALAEGMRRTFLTKTARSQKQSIVFFQDPFKLVPMSMIADVADKFTRNEILSSNEIRALVGFKPSSDPRADELRNKNLNQSNQERSSQHLEGLIPENEETMEEESIGDIPVSEVIQNGT